MEAQHGRAATVDTPPLAASMPENRLYEVVIVDRKQAAWAAAGPGRAVQATVHLAAASTPEDAILAVLGDMDLSEQLDVARVSARVKAYRTVVHRFERLRADAVLAMLPAADVPTSRERDGLPSLLATRLWWERA